MSLSVVLFCIAGLGALAMGLKYSVSPVPMRYHAEMLGAAADPPSDGLRNVLTGLYRAFGGALSGLALAIICLALWPIAAGNLPAATGTFLAGSFAATATALAALKLERRTGVRTPWRIAAGLEVVLVAALIAFLL